MSEQQFSAQTTESEQLARGNRLNQLLGGLVAFEAVVIWAAAVWLVIELGTASPESFRTAIALTVLTALIALWVSASAVALFRRARWARGSAVTWQVLQAAVAVGAIQGDAPNWLVAVALLIPALAVVLLAISPAVRAVYGLDELSTD